MLTPDELAEIRATYEPGRRVRFLGFGEPDPRPLQPRTGGTVRRVDDAGTVHVAWDNGMFLGCVVKPIAHERPDRLEFIDDPTNTSRRAP
jgi:hypothetical protein